MSKKRNTSNRERQEERKVKERQRELTIFGDRRRMEMENVAPRPEHGLAGSGQSPVTRPRPRSGPFPLDDLTFDLITILHEKSKGLEGFEKYLEDARDDPDLRLSLEDIREQDERAIRDLQQHLYRVMLERHGRAA
jgi:hypothetical protein